MQLVKKRRRFTPEFKSKIALEALREREPIHEIAKRFPYESIFHDNEAIVVKVGLTP